MKKLIALLLALALSSALTVSFADQLSEAQARGSLIFATEGNWAPWTYYGDDGARAGGDIAEQHGCGERDGAVAEHARAHGDEVRASDILEIESELLVFSCDERDGPLGRERIIVRAGLERDGAGEDLGELRRCSLRSGIAFECAHAAGIGRSVERLDEGDLIGIEMRFEVGQRLGADVREDCRGDASLSDADIDDVAHHLRKG